MNIPVEVVIFICTSLTGFLTICVHQLMRINANLARVCTQHEVSTTAVNLRLSALERHDANNRRETEAMNRYRQTAQPS